MKVSVRQCLWCDTKWVLGGGDPSIKKKILYIFSFRDHRLICELLYIIGYVQIALENGKGGFYMELNDCSIRNYFHEVTFRVSCF